jgi:2-polyprenyl-6-methoxyphenol hydroxylase-like FAD-dependent oxidoreductase
MSIGIVGAGTAGLHLALYLQQHGVESTLYAERSADEVRGGRIMNTVAHNHRTRARERALGVNHWDDVAPPIHGHWHYLPGEQPLAFPGYFENPSMSVDYRLYQATLLEDVEERGGRIVLGPIGADDLPALGERHELVVVSTGRGSLAGVFAPLPDRSPYDGPQRLLAAGLFTGLDHSSETHYVTLSLAPPHGEIIEIPMQSFAGHVSVLLFECIPGGELEVLARTAYDDDPKAYERLVLDKLRAFNPPLLDRLDAGAFGLMSPTSFLQGALTPTVRTSHTRLDNGTYAIAVGDAHVVMDPVVGLGGNAASFGAWTLGEAIVEGGPYDEGFCRRVDGRRLPMILGSFDFTNFMLRPQPYLVDVIGAMSQSLPLANDFTDAFTDPPRQMEHLASADAAAAYIAELTASAG